MRGFLSWHSVAALGLLLLLGREERDKWTERRMKGIYSSLRWRGNLHKSSLVRGRGTERKRRIRAELSQEDKQLSLPDPDCTWTATVFPSSCMTW